MSKPDYLLIFYVEKGDFGAPLGTCFLAFMKLSYITLVGFLLITASCERESPTVVNRPPIIEGFSPETSDLTAFVGDTLDFSITALDPDRNTLDYLFRLEDSTVSKGPSWRYVVKDPGTIIVEASVSDGLCRSRVRWYLERVEPTNLPPVFTYFEPLNPNPSILIGDSLQFIVRAEDPEGKSINYTYLINDTIVGHERHYTYRSRYIGEVMVKALASDDKTYTWRNWSLRVTGYPDSIPPAVVPIISLKRGENPGELVAEWIAVGDDSMEGLPSYYVVRTSSVPFISEYDWNRGSDRPGEPSPAPPGDTLRMVIEGLIPASYVYVALRAVDEFRNFSPLGSSPAEWAKGNEVYGAVHSALTTEPLPGLSIYMNQNFDTTDTQGHFALTELGPVTASLFVRDENEHGYGNFFDLVLPYEVEHGDWLDIWLIPNEPLESSYYPEVLTYFKRMTYTQANHFGNYLRTWELPISIYIPPFTKGGLDYAEVVRKVLPEWEEAAGFKLFELAYSPPDVGVSFSYEGGLNLDYYEITKRSDDMFPIQAVIHMRTVYADSSAEFLRRIVLHETGHALGLGHSDDPNHIMVGGREPIITRISQDEAWLVRMLYHIPRGMQMDAYVYD